ncbi:hypothetical protein [Burkholderia pseudomallei]|uniref:hypothetical protein n=1 Tax=Burkholderia pseudomallei TaxID=28450 RepID=UPI00193E79A3|nr:hypothetical protein [Burkholderia pseudomallei]QRM23545.1 hypothetical protein JQX71_04470 [Burkholderia pseudomallei]
MENVTIHVRLGRGGEKVEATVLYEFPTVYGGDAGHLDDTGWVVRLADGSTKLALMHYGFIHVSDTDELKELIAGDEELHANYRKAIAMVEGADYRPTGSTVVSSTTGENGFSFVINVPAGGAQ